MRKKSFLKVCIFRTLFSIKRIFIRKNKKKYILLINYNNLGDLVCDTPSLRNIRNKYLNHKIILLVRNKSCVEFMRLCPYVDSVIEMPHSKEPFKNYKKFANLFLKYRFEFSMQFVRPFNEYYRTYLPYMICIKNRYGLIQTGYENIYDKAFTIKEYLDNTTTRTEESLNLLKLANITIDNDKTECWFDEKEVQTLNYKNYIVIQTCATLNSRMWHKNRFVELINKISKSHPDLTILLTGVQSEQSYIEQIKSQCLNKNNIFILCNLNISTLLYVIKNAKMLITNDTGPLHFAIALKTPLISIFGISPPKYLIKEQTDNCIYFRGGNVCSDSCDLKNEDCIKNYKHNINTMCCINNVKPQQVYETFLYLINR